MTERHPGLKCLHHWPTRMLCIGTLVLQSATINWYLMSELSFVWAAIYVADAVVVALFITAIVWSTKNIHIEKRLEKPGYKDIRHMPLTYVAWIVYVLLLEVKVIALFTNPIVTKLDEVYFFGPNTLNTALALSGIVFASFLSTQHDLRHGYRKHLLLGITGTVLFDILDGVDVLEDLYDEELRNSFPKGLDDAIIGLFCVNLLLATVPLYTLARMKFGLRKLSKNLELLHKLSIAYLINLPLFIIRMITWHGLSQGVSIFGLKNIIAMGVTSFEVLEQHFTQDYRRKVRGKEATDQGRNEGQNQSESQSQNNPSIVDDTAI